MCGLSIGTEKSKSVTLNGLEQRYVRSVVYFGQKSMHAVSVLAQPLVCSS